MGKEEVNTLVTKPAQMPLRQRKNHTSKKPNLKSQKKNVVGGKKERICPLRMVILCVEIVRIHKFIRKIMNFYMAGAVKKKKKLPGTMPHFCEFQYSPTKNCQEECSKKR